VKHGIYVSASGIITFDKAESVREGFRRVPLQLLMVETDAPYLAPVPFRGKTCEPAFTVNTAQYLADLKQVPLAELAEATTNNFFKLFSRAKREWEEN
jgi:TatD DNase family protein